MRHSLKNKLGKGIEHGTYEDLLVLTALIGVVRDKLCIEQACLQQYKQNAVKIVLWFTIGYNLKWSGIEKAFTANYVANTSTGDHYKAQTKQLK